MRLQDHSVSRDLQRKPWLCIRTSTIKFSNLKILVEGHHQKILTFVSELQKRHGSPESCGYTHSSTTKYLFPGSSSFGPLGYHSCPDLCDNEDKWRKRESPTFGDCLSLGSWIAPLAVIAYTLGMKSAFLVRVFIQMDWRIHLKQMTRNVKKAC